VIHASLYAQTTFLIEASVGAALAAVETDFVVVVIAFTVANDDTVLVTVARHVGGWGEARPGRNAFIAYPALHRRRHRRRDRWKVLGLTIAVDRLLQKLL